MTARTGKGAESDGRRGKYLTTISYRDSINNDWVRQRRDTEAEEKGRETGALEAGAGTGTATEALAALGGVVVAWLLDAAAAGGVVLPMVDEVALTVES